MPRKCFIVPQATNTYTRTTYIPTYSLLLSYNSDAWHWLPGCVCVFVLVWTPVWCISLSDRWQLLYWMIRKAFVHIEQYNGWCLGVAITIAPLGVCHQFANKLLHDFKHDDEHAISAYFTFMDNLNCLYVICHNVSW